MSDTSRRSQAPASWPSPSPIAIAKDSPLEASTAAVALVLAYVVALSIEFEAGAGYTVPTVLVLVPMLYLLPPAPVPLCVVAAHLVSYVVKVLLGRRHAAHLWAVFGQGWHSLGPALVLSLASPGHASWDDLPLLGAAFVGDVVFDAAASHPNDEPRPSDRQPAAEASERHGASD